MSENIKVDKSDGILTLVIARPAKKNALTDAMYKVLADELEAAQDNPEVRVVLLRGEGDVFTSGNDVGEFAAVAMGAPMPENVQRFIRALARAVKPIVAAAQGSAVGVGATLLLHCDHVVLADNAQLITPFVNLALVPEAASTLLLTARIGHPRAFTMFALGTPVDAKTALDWGLANQVVSLGDLVSTAENIARRLARQPIGALVATKTMMRDAAAMLARMSVEGEHFLARLTTAEAREAFSAFAERRTPDFTKVS